ncbi:MAG: peptidoglycan editing factor PgeF [Cyanobacteria bacterium P01_F01_bin.150]
MHTWTWKKAGDAGSAQTSQRAYLTCDLLAPWNHGFFTHAWWPSPPAEITPDLDPSATAYRVKQVHGNCVLTPTAVDHYQQQRQQQDEQFPFPNADGLMSEKAGQALWVASADCTPALIADVKTGAVSAVHAGWRGTAQQIIPVAIRQMQQQGSQIQDIRVALGPAIDGEVYQVSTTVAAQVSQTVLSNRLVQDSLTDTDVDHILIQVQAIRNPPVLEDNQEGRARLDVRRVNQLQLESLGMTEGQVAIAPYCTFQTPEHFFSYRRERLKKVQWSGIVSR